MWSLYIHFHVLMFNLSYQDGLINSLLHNTVFPEVLETKQHISVAYWLLLTNTGIKLRPKQAVLMLNVFFESGAVTRSKTRSSEVFRDHTTGRFLQDRTPKEFVKSAHGSSGINRMAYHIR